MKSRIVALVAITLVGTGVCAAQSTQPGRWVKHDITFNYLPLTTTYSCQGLAHKLQVLLGLAGARKDMQVNGFGCAHGAGVPDKLARARLIFYSLQPIGASAGETQAQDSDVTAGAWSTVKVRLSPRSELAVGDCELIEQFRREVLSKAFSVRMVSEPGSCTPYQRSMGAFSLTFEAFAPAKG